MKINIGFSSKRKQRSLEKWLILERGQDRYKMSLERVVGPESEEVLTKQSPQ